MLGLVFLIKEFGIDLVTTAGGPGTRSYTLTYAVYIEVFSANNVGRASALAVLTVALDTASCQLLYRSIVKRSARYSRRGGKDMAEKSFKTSTAEYSATQNDEKSLLAILI